MKTSVKKILLLFTLIVSIQSGPLFTSFSNKAFAQEFKYRGSKKKRKKAFLVVTTARVYKGTPYRTGGTGNAGMDCSGLVLTSYKAIDQALPHSAIKLSKMGKRASSRKLKPGDLVFFATGKKKRRINHVGIVTSADKKGNVRFIHASTSKGVMESGLTDTYWKKRFRKARRMI